MLEFIAGLALGAAFAPFWMMVWTFIKTNVLSKYLKK